MARFIIHSVVNGVDSLENQKNAILTGFRKAHALAKSIGGEVLITVAQIQYIRSGHINDSLGEDFSKALAQTDPFQVDGVTIRRVASAKFPRSVGPDTVVWMVHPDLRSAEHMTKACASSTNIVVTEWFTFDELNRWKSDNKAKVI